jgi:outer membrane protein W
MKKIVISTIIATTLATNMMAEVKPYIGLGYNSFTISTKDTDSRNKRTGATSTSSEETSDSGTTIGLNGGVILNDNSKINFSYFSGKEKDSEIFKTTVMAISYDYGFNNSGVRKGWYVGAGFSSIKTEMEGSTLRALTSATGTGLLFRGGYEHQINDNALLDIGFNVHTAKQELKYDFEGNNNFEGSTTTTVSNLNISVNYIF